MIFAAIVLAGGRSSRLDGADKATFVLEGSTLLERACEAVAAASQIVIVGAVDNPPAGIEVVVENPRFGGPAAAIGAGLTALGEEPADLIAILACDLPHARDAFAALYAAAQAGFDGDAVIAADDSGKRQTLLGIYRAEPLRDAVAAAGDLDGMAVRKLLADLSFTEVAVPEGSTFDVDTWHDVEESGIESHPPKGDAHRG